MIAIDHTQDRCQVTIAGRFDFTRVVEFQQLLKTEATSWEIDLRQVVYVDSSALGMLLILRDRMKGDRTRIRLRLIPGQTHDILLMARFDALFTLDVT